MTAARRTFASSLFVGALVLAAGAATFPARGDDAKDAKDAKKDGGAPVAAATATPGPAPVAASAVPAASGGTQSGRHTFSQKG